MEKAESYKLIKWLAYTGDAGSRAARCQMFIGWMTAKRIDQSNAEVWQDMAEFKTFMTKLPIE